MRIYLTVVLYHWRFTNKFSVLLTVKISAASSSTSAASTPGVTSSSSAAAVCPENSRASVLVAENVSWLVLLLSPGSTSVLASSRRTLGAEPRLLMRTTRAVMEDMQTRVTMHEMPMTVCGDILIGPCRVESRPVFFLSKYLIIPKLGTSCLRWLYLGEVSASSPSVVTATS